MNILNRIEYKFENLDSKNYRTSFAEYVEQAADVLLHPLGLLGRSYKISVTTNAKGDELIPGQIIPSRPKVSFLSVYVFIVYLTVPFAAPIGLLAGYAFKKFAGLSPSVAAKHQYISEFFTADKLKQQLTSQLSVETRLNGKQGSSGDIYGMGIAFTCGACAHGCGCA